MPFCRNTRVPNASRAYEPQQSHRTVGPCPYLLHTLWNQLQPFDRLFYRRYHNIMMDEDVLSSACRLFSGTVQLNCAPTTVYCMYVHLSIYMYLFRAWSRLQLILGCLIKLDNDSEVSTCILRLVRKEDGQNSDYAIDESKTSGPLGSLLSRKAYTKKSHV